MGKSGKVQKVIERGGKIVCPHCGQKAKTWNGHISDYAFICWCGATVRMLKRDDGKAVIE